MLRYVVTPVQMYSHYAARPPALLCTTYATLCRNLSTAVLTLRRLSTLCFALLMLRYVVTPVQLYSPYAARPRPLFCTTYTTLCRNPSTAVLTLRRLSTHPVLHYLCYVVTPVQLYSLYAVRPPALPLLIRKRQKLALAFRQCRRSYVATATELMTLCIKFLTC